MKRIVVTSCHLNGYEEYGRKMLDTFVEYWPEDISLILVSEDDLTPPTHDRIIFAPYKEFAPEGNHFKAKFAHFSEANGMMYKEVGAPNERTIKVIYNYLFDAIRFSHKVFSVFGASRKYDTDALIWIDADTFTHTPIDDAFFEGVDPGGGHMSYLGRDKKYSECGFLYFNRRHPVHEKFMEQIVTEYLNGEIFLLREWHDCIMFDIMREHFSKSEGVQYRNISGKGAATMHPFVNSVLGSYMDHLKGPTRKIAGRSSDEDLI